MSPTDTKLELADEAAFAALVERYRRPLHLHCYRMLGSLDEAVDLVQEALGRAWRGRARFSGRSGVGTWLYRIATNVCLSALARRPRRVMPPDVGPPTLEPPVEGEPPPEVPWLQPYPGHLLEQLASSDPEPGAAVVARETVELAYLAAIQHLTPRARAILILRDAPDWSAKETADLLDRRTSAPRGRTSCLAQRGVLPRPSWPPETGAP